MDLNSQESVAVQLTESAVKQVQKLLHGENLEGYGLRISTVTGGCSGFSYKLDFERVMKPDDAVVEQDGLKVYVDGSTLENIKGTVIDYKSGRMASGFTFENPKAAGTCGCGTSFAV